MRRHAPPTLTLLGAEVREQAGRAAHERGRRGRGRLSCVARAARTCSISASPSPAPRRASGWKLRAFARDAERADWAVVYFAGHGIEIGGVNYLIPVDARLETDRDAQFEAVALEQVLGAVEGAKKLRLVVLDACRDNPFAQRMKRTVASRSIGRGLARVEPEGGTLVAYAAKHGEIALDGEGTNSPFVTALLKHMPTPGVEINKLFRLVRDDVMTATGRRQEPFIYGSLPAEDFFFVAAK